MIKIMLFIDGTWLYSNTPKLAELYGKGDFQVDFGWLPKVLAEEVNKQLGGVEVDVVRTYLFGSYASNYDLRDDDAVQRRLDFFSMLKEEYHYELEIFPVNFKGRRLRRGGRGPPEPLAAHKKKKGNCAGPPMPFNTPPPPSFSPGHCLYLGVERSL